MFRMCSCCLVGVCVLCLCLDVPWLGHLSVNVTLPGYPNLFLDQILNVDKLFFNFKAAYSVTLNIFRKKYLLLKSFAKVE